MFLSVSLLLFFLGVEVLGGEWKGIGTEPGPWVRATRGEPWPLPQQYNKSEDYFVLQPYNFRFVIANQTCDILTEAVTRYTRVILNQEKSSLNVHQKVIDESKIEQVGALLGYVSELKIDLSQPCETLPHFQMDESYELTQSTLKSKSIWGVVRGLETFTQLITPDENGTALIIRNISIADSPRFSYRGLMIDTSRHFEPVSALLSILDGMEANKFNVFHWHIVDDQSFPYQSTKFPELSDKGAYTRSRHVYTQSDVRKIIKYATLRGIRVVPEFDTPGHTRSWGQGMTSILTPCYGNNNEPDGSFGPLDPTKDEVYEFINSLFSEVNSVFPDDHFHIGGDEVVFQCWTSNPNVSKFMSDRNLTARGLQEYYIQKVVQSIQEMKSVPMVWQEVFDDGAKLSPDVLVHIWKGGQKAELSKVTKAGYHTILSSCWYLSQLSSGGDWQKFYDCEPHDFDGTDDEKTLVIGGEACMWGEYVDVNNLSTRVWPRASAVAERLWSDRQTTDKNQAAQRLEEHVCRMNRRNIKAQPANSAGFCPDVNF